MSQVDPHALESAGEKAIAFVMEMLVEPLFWILIVVLVLGATLVRHGWPWRKKG